MSLLGTFGRVEGLGSFGKYVDVIRPGAGPSQGNNDGRANGSQGSDSAGGDCGVRPGRTVGRSWQAFDLDEPGAAEALGELVDGPCVRGDDLVVERREFVCGEASGDERPPNGDDPPQVGQRDVDFRGTKVDERVPREDAAQRL